jgi:hypothetical protein
VLRDIVEVIAKAIGWLLGRPTLRVRIREDEPKTEVGGLVFEVENVSDKMTSLHPTVTATFLSIKREPYLVAFDVREGDRNLPPFTPKQFSASAREVQPQRFHSWFRTYNFSPTRGRTCRVRLKNASLETMRLWRFWGESLWFRATGRVGGVKTSMAIDEYRAQQRSRGPH